MRNSRIVASKEGKLPVTKIECAVRQLEVAITIWFYDGDPVVICTLTHAAYEIIHSINTIRGGPPMIVDCANIQDDFKKDVAAIFRADANFLKHAGQDPDEIHFLGPLLLPGRMLDAVSAYNRFNFGKRPIFEVLVLWLQFHQPVLFSEVCEKCTIQGVLIDRNFGGTKHGFFEESMPLFMGRLAIPTKDQTT